jgi:hypothetical protein
MRKLQRSIARQNAKNAKIQNVNKKTTNQHTKETTSKFSRNWRKWSKVGAK